MTSAGCYCIAGAGETGRNARGNGHTVRSPLPPHACLYNTLAPHGHPAGIPRLAARDGHRARKTGVPGRSRATACTPCSHVRLYHVPRTVVEPWRPQAMDPGAPPRGHERQSYRARVRGPGAQQIRCNGENKRAAQPARGGRGSWDAAPVYLIRADHPRGRKRKVDMGRVTAVGSDRSRRHERPGRRTGLFSEYGQRKRRDNHPAPLLSSDSPFLPASREGTTVWGRCFSWSNERGHAI